jgi:hypothetical protein
MKCKPETDKEKKIRKQCEIETMKARNELLSKIYDKKG